MKSLLNDREFKLLGLRWGFLDNQRRTLSETGSEFGVTRQKIRQIELEAFEKLEENYSEWH